MLINNSLQILLHIPEFVELMLENNDYENNHIYYINQIINLIDSGNLGTSVSCQIIFPFKTSCYNDNQEVLETSIPMCTLHNFSSNIG